MSPPTIFSARRAVDARSCPSAMATASERLAQHLLAARDVADCAHLSGELLMTITVDYIDSNHMRLTRPFTLTLPQFLKHFVMAGAGFRPTHEFLARGLGALLWYSHFVEPVLSGHQCFGQPPPILRDPSLKAHFSNLSGRAFASFLGRELEQAWITLSYEGVLAVLAHPQVGPRPDLIAVGPQSITAIEAKGYAKTAVSDEEMLRHKNQAAQGPLPRDRWAASVAFGLYDAVKVKYHDPSDEGTKPDRDDSLAHLQRYFAEVEAAAQQVQGTPRTIDRRTYLAVPLADAARGRVPLDVAASDALNKVTLLIDADGAATTRKLLQSSLAQGGPQSEVKSAVSIISTESMYVDLDGIGISTAG